MYKSPLPSRPVITVLAVIVSTVCNITLLAQLPFWATVAIEVALFTGIFIWHRWVSKREPFSKLLESDPASVIDRWIDPITGEEMRERVITKYLVIDTDGMPIDGITARLRRNTN